METTEINTRRKGNVARLPKVLRDKVNTMLDDGATYPEIVAELQKSTNPPLPHPVSEDNVRRWFDGGFQDWLKEREKAEQFGNEIEYVEDLLSRTNADEVPDLVIKLAASRFCGYVKDLAPDQLRSTAEEDPTNLVRLLSLLPKFSREVLRTRKFRRSVQREESQQLQQRDPNKPFGDDNDHRAVVDIVDKVLGLGRYTRPRKPVQLSTDTPSPELAEQLTNADIAPAMPATEQQQTNN